MAVLPDGDFRVRPEVNDEAGFISTGQRREQRRVQRLVVPRVVQPAVRRGNPVPLVGARVPHILNLTVPGIRGETLLHALSARGICVSTGSACSSHSPRPSAALAAFGLPADEIGSSIRVSFSAWNTEDDVRALADALREETGRLVRIQR